LTPAVFTDLRPPSRRRRAFGTTVDERPNGRRGPRLLGTIQQGRAVRRAFLSAIRGVLVRMGEPLARFH
jgi:hypothetical protein